VRHPADREQVVIQHLGLPIQNVANAYISPVRHDSSKAHRERHELSVPGALSKWNTGTDHRPGRQDVPGKTYQRKRQQKRQQKLAEP
jgi:hypothetical protein